MKKSTPFSVLAGLMTVGAAASVFAASVSPFGTFGNYEKVELLVERTPAKDKGVIIDGKLYVPIDLLRDQNKLAYYYDPNSFQTYIFFGGSATNTQASTTASKNTPRNVNTAVMQGIPYEARNYHSGMMRQDVMNIATLVQAFNTTTKAFETAVYTKLTANREPDINLLRQQLAYRSAPLQMMEDRMEALAEQLGDQVGSRYERKMDDVIDAIQDAIENKEDALDALEDWIDSSREDDLDDFRDYEEDAFESIDEALQILIGEDLENPNKKHSDNLRDELDNWTKKQSKK